MIHLAHSILCTITWFNIFDYPLTLDEIYWWLYNPCYKKTNQPEGDTSTCRLQADSFFTTGDGPNALRERINSILKRELSDYIQKKDNYHFLKHRQEIILTRQQRYQHSRQKMKRVKRLQQFLKYFPFIKMAALCNVLGYMNSDDYDDIDVFIITQKTRIWSARFWLTGILKILNLRPKLKSGKISNKFCLSFWITEDYMNLEGVMLDFSNKKEKTSLTSGTRGQACLFNLGDIYFHYWLAGLRPIYDADSYFQNFLQSNQWVKKYLPHLEEYYQESNLQTYKLTNLPAFTKLFQKLQPQFLEKFYRWFQLKWMPDELKELSKQGVGVIIKDNILKLHWQDKRAEFREKFLNKW